MSRITQLLRKASARKASSRRTGYWLTDNERQQVIRNGACTACLDGMVIAFPLDPRHHKYRTGHAPVLGTS